mmetsp:Transcript_42035/g.65720  ORF Transcript_42035/g.65720 Transcript_42035/m.65720 type:complete len:282 (-) Transcript_42035:203-1048(-)
MSALWLNAPIVQCILPGEEPIQGYEDIISMWTEMFTSVDKSFTTTQISPSDVRVHVRGNSAFVCCKEEVSTSEGLKLMLATNVFKRLGGQWYLVHHHTSLSLRERNSIQDPLGGPKVKTITVHGTPESLTDPGGQVLGDILKAIQEAHDETFKETGTDPSEFDRGIDRSDEEPPSPLVLPSQIAAKKDLSERELIDGVTERTINALRRLTKERKLSARDKNKLISSIISHHKVGGEASLVEIAYQVLVFQFLKPGIGGGAREDELLLDFLDQCRALVMKLP